MRFPGSIDAVLFDLDDTLVDHRGASERGLRGWLAGLGLAEDDADLERHVDRWFAIEARHYERYQRREITHLEHRRRRIRDFLADWDLSDDRLADETFADFLGCYQAAWRAFDDAAEAIAAARAAGLRVAILTNGEQAVQENKVRRTGLAGLGARVLASSELPAAKPDPRAFHAACATLGVEPSRCAMVGDSERHDLRGAQRAGLVGVLLDRTAAPTAAGTPRISSLRELDWSAARGERARAVAGGLERG
ncbi:HAD family hydrolase [Nocardioides sp. GY 10113]|uniref:HAD family hydrolase n=1 Tax=Nocardioides sp. GY 10113 TaxID=2569761 RepID=UPI0010A7EE64|nr:HAD family hydrolase [Nocardioides sp. GY 10113]TIC89242.1 HAD family hydrolase [Nocardioides sp. GY 10113]